MVIGGGSTSFLGQKSHIVDVAQYSQNFTDTCKEDSKDIRPEWAPTLLWKQGWGEQDRPPEQSWPRAGMSAYCHLFNSLGASCAGRFRWAFNQACSTTYHSAKCSWCKSSRWLSFGLRTPRRKAGRYKRREAPSPGYQQTQFTELGL